MPAEGAATEDYNTGRAAIGTGPYRLVSYRSGDRIEMARNDAYFGGAEPWARVSYRIIANDAARTAALLAGDLDLIEQVPTSDLARLRRDPRVAVHRDPVAAHRLHGARLLARRRHAAGHRQCRPAAAGEPLQGRARAPRAVAWRSTARRWWSG